MFTRLYSIYSCGCGWLAAKQIRSKYVSPGLGSYLILFIINGSHVSLLTSRYATAQFKFTPTKVPDPHKNYIIYTIIYTHTVRIWEVLLRTSIMKDYIALIKHIHNIRVIIVSINNPWGRQLAPITRMLCLTTIKYPHLFQTIPLRIWSAQAWRMQILIFLSLLDSHFPRISQGQMLNHSGLNLLQRFPMLVSLFDRLYCRPKMV